MTSTRTTLHVPARARLHTLDRPPVLRPGRAPYVLSVLLAVAAVAAAAPSLFAPDLLGGAEVGKGNLRGTALVVLLVVPMMLAAVHGATRNSARWLVVWVGSAAYLLYQAVLFCFATPFNSLFLAYVAFLALGLYTLVVLLLRVDTAGFAARVDRGMPHRTLAATAMTFAVLNGAAWLARVVPASLDDDPASVLDGSGLLTSSVWVQDLAFWIPCAVLVGVWAWHREGRGVFLLGALLVFYVVECLSIASDQWWGARADDTQPDWASMTMVPAFAAVAVLLLVPLAAHLRHVDRT